MNNEVKTGNFIRAVATRRTCKLRGKQNGQFGTEITRLSKEFRPYGAMHIPNINHFWRKKTMNTKRIVSLGLAGLVTLITGCGNGINGSNHEEEYTEKDSYSYTQKIDTAPQQPEKKCWEKTDSSIDNYDEKVFSIRQTIDNGYVMAVSSWATESSESDVWYAWIAKRDANGDVEWDTFFGSTDGNYVEDYLANAVRQTNEGGYVICGEKDTYTGDGYNAKGYGWIAKVTKTGEIEWEKEFGGIDSYGRKEFRSIEQTNDGGYITAGLSGTYNNSEEEGMWILKLSQNGGSLWDKILPGKYTAAQSIKQTDDDGYIIGGAINASSGNGFNGRIVKLDKNGDKEWEQSYCHDDDCWIQDIQQTDDGGYVATGSSGIPILPGPPGDYDLPPKHDLWVLKIDNSGNTEWEKIYGVESNNEQGHEIQQTSDLGYIVAGGNWILKLDNAGEFLWDNVPNGEMYSIQQTTGLGYIAGGFRKVISEDMYFMKLDSNGKLCE